MMEQQYIVPLEDMDMKPVYSDLQVVQVPQDEVGSLVLQDDGGQQLVFNDQQQVVYQAAQYQQAPQQAAAAAPHYIIGSSAGDELVQQQQQVMHHPHYQQQQDHHLEQQPQYVQQPVQHAQPIYYTSEQVLQPNTIVQHASMQQLQQQQQQQQKKQQQVLQQQQYAQHATYVQASPQQQPPTQLLQTSSQQQAQQQGQTLQLQPASGQQQQQQHQIVYRMAASPQQQQRPISMLNNAHVIVQQQTGQLVLSQTPQPHPEIIMRQQGINLHAYNNRVVYATSPQQQQQLQQQQQQQLQQQQLQLQAQTAHLVQTRVVPQQAPNQVVYQQVQMQKTPSPQQQPQQPQLVATSQPQPVGAPGAPQLVRAGFRGKSPRGGGGATGGTIVARHSTGTLIATRPALAPTIVRHVRPRGGATAGVATGLVRNMRPAGIRPAARAQLVVQTSTGSEMQLVSAPNQQTATKQITITNLGQQQQEQSMAMQPRHIYRTHMVAESPPNPQHQHQMLMTRQVPIKYRAPTASVTSSPGATTAVVGPPPPMPTQSNPGGGVVGMDLEERIQAAVLQKKEQQKPPPSISNPMQLQGTSTTLTTFYTAGGGGSGGAGVAGSAVAPNNSSEDEQQNVIQQQQQHHPQAVRTAGGASMTLAEFKKRQTTLSNVSPSSAAAATTSSPVTTNRPTTMRPTPKLTPTPGILPPGIRIIHPPRINPPIQPTPNPTPPAPQPIASSVQQTSHNNYEIHSQHVLNNRAGQDIADRDRNSAKMLVILASGEQRLITFTLPRESCTVQDLLEQVGVQFDNTTTIQCVEHRGANVDFVVTVGFSVNESASELISRAEESLQMNRQQEQQHTQQQPQPPQQQQQQHQQQQQQQQSGISSTASTTGVSTNTAAPPPSSSTNYNQANAAAEQAKREAAAAVASSTSLSPSPSIAVEGKKLIDGYYAVCQLCGFTGMDHAKCERCKRVFQEPPKRKSYMTKSSAASSPASATSSTSSTSASATLSEPAAEKKRELATTAGQTRYNKVIGVNYGSGGATSTGSGVRGRGGVAMRGNRTRGGRRVAAIAEVDPVVLLSSEDEADNEDAAANETENISANQNKRMSNASEWPASFACDPMLPEIDEERLYKGFFRGDVTDLTGIAEREQFTKTLTCSCVRFMSMRFELIEPIICTPKGLRVVGILSDKDRDQKFTLHIYKQEVIKVIAHLASNNHAQPLVTLFLLRNCAQYVKMQLQLPDDEEQEQESEQTEFKSQNWVHTRRLILLFDGCTSLNDRVLIKTMFNCVDEISSLDAAKIFKGIAESDHMAATENQNSRQLRQNEQINLLMYPPKGTGSLCIRMEDYMCLTKESYLNDIIIDFYLLWLRNTQLTEQQRERTHIFSTFFYKRLTTLTRPTDMKQTAAQKRHARVQKWTKVVDIFDKDFIIVPINEQSHWFLAIICFPCLKGPVTYDTNQPVEPQQLKRGNRGKKAVAGCSTAATAASSLQIGNTTITPLSKRGDGGGLTATAGTEICCIPGDDESERDEAEGDESDMASDESENSQPAKEMPNPIAAGSGTTAATGGPSANFSTSSGPARSRGQVAGDDIPAVKQPLILIFDSLAGASRSRVVATLRDYLTCEYRVKKPDAQAHIFNKDNMPGHCVKVPQQQNFTDCGLYLLQYVEQFFSQPITDYRLPIKQLTNWFDFLTVTKKREDIAQLIQKLMDEANKHQKQRLILPLIEFPTLNGQLVEYPDDTESAEFEEEEGLGGSGELEPDDEPGSEVHDDNNSEAMDVDPQANEDSSLPKTGSISSIATTTTTTTITRRPALKRRLQNGAAVATTTAVATTGTTATATTTAADSIISSNGNACDSLASQQVTTTPTSANSATQHLVTGGIAPPTALTTAASVSTRNPSGNLKIRKIEP